MPLSQVKLFKPPVVRETLLIIQKTFFTNRNFLPYKSNKNIAAPWDLLYEFNPYLMATAAETRKETRVFPKLN